MEVKETAACGISQREFAIEFDTDDLPEIFRVFRFAQDGTGYYDDDFLEDLKSQMAYIIGPSLEEEPPDEHEDVTIHWEDEGTTYNLCFNEQDSRILLQILSSVDHPGEGLDKVLNQKLLEQMLEMAPSVLENLPIINR